MNEELVLHILKTACYGLNLDFSLIPQPPYLYIFFDRSPEAVLDYPTLTETIRLAAVSAGLPPEYEYLALYSRILGEADPDWETAIYLYQETQPTALYEQDLQVSADSDVGVGVDIDAGVGIDADADVGIDIDAGVGTGIDIDADLVSSDQKWSAHEFPPGAEELAEELADESPNDRELPNPAEESSLAENVPPDQDNFTVDPTIVFATDPGSRLEATELGSSEIDPPAALDSSIPSIDTEEIDDDIDIDSIAALPLPPPPPVRPKTTAPVPQATIAPEPPAAQQKGDDMAQFYFKAKAKPKAVPQSSALPVVAVPQSTQLPVVAEAEVTEAAPVIVEEIDLSGYCFIRNKLLLDSAIKPPSKEVIDLIAQLHLFSAIEKEKIATLLDNLYRQPPKKEESSGESALYQVGEVDLQELAEPIQEWFQAVIALDPEPFRKSAIWFSRYCHNPQKTIAELMPS